MINENVAVASNLNQCLVSRFLRGKNAVTLLFKEAVGGEKQQDYKSYAGFTPDTNFCVTVCSAVAYSELVFFHNG